MKPLSILISGFGPYVEPQKVDFTEYYDDGLFLIRGETGSGKTTILDAMCFALYGKIPGDRGKALYKVKDQELNVRPASVPDNVATEVVFEVELSGRRFRFRRSPTYITGSGTKRLHKASIEEWDGSTYQPLTNTVTDVSDVARQCVGMDAEQFAQLILLPQGKFAEFLFANSKEREKILSLVFPMDTYQNIMDWFKTQRQDTNEALKASKSAVDIAQAKVIENLGEEPDSTLTFIQWIEQSLKDLTKVLKSHQTEHKKAADAAKKAAEAVTLAESKSEALKEFREAETSIAQATLSLSELAAKVADSTITQPYSQSLPAVIAGLSTQTASLKDQLTQAKTLATTQLEVVESQKSVAQSEKVLKGLEEAIKAAQNERVALKKSADAKTNVSAKLPTLEKTQTSLTDQIQRCSDLALASTQLSKAQETWDLASKQVVVSGAAVDKIRASIDADMAAKLAANLVDGHACAVCGSADHPAPAKPVKGTPTSDELTQAQATLESRRSQLTEATASRAAAKEKVSTLEKAITKSDLPNDIAQLEKQLHETVTEIAAVSVAIEEAQSRASALAELETSIEAQQIVIDEAKKVLSELKIAHAVVETTAKNLQATLPKDFDPQAIELAHAQIDGRITLLNDILDVAKVLEKSLVTAKAKLDANASAAKDAGADIEPLKAAAQLAKSQAEQIAHQITIVNARANRLTEQLPEIQAAHDAVTAAQELKTQWDNIAEYVEGNQGRKIALTRFYIGQRLKQVVAQASVRLAKMSAGRYTLLHDETIKDANGSGSGLAVLVYDKWQGEARGPETISGGEKFMASLALALGLSDVVKGENGGARLESLFIDEGFGSLDDDTLNDVMDILDGLREHGRLVGVVSHVAAMRDRIPKQLIVSKNKNGSVISSN
ncbi:MAG: AAA family ATPase [Actinobacteria bacterium]|uniref:Unannotated protein n=1 Tax=freshwater metagenome TaxID=449393 RepID=A0A6J5ZEB3_9ZZZZ|nr:AAA family ATPase [Actinomycetota bacterium]